MCADAHGAARDKCAVNATLPPTQPCTNAHFRTREGNCTNVEYTYVEFPESETQKEETTMPIKHTQPWVVPTASPLRETARLMMLPPVVTYAHAGRLLGVTRSRARQLVTEGALKTTVQQGRTYVLKSSVDALIATKGPHLL